MRDGYSVKDFFLDFDSNVPHTVVRIFFNERNLSLQTVEYFVTENCHSVY